MALLQFVLEADHAVDNTSVDSLEMTLVTEVSAGMHAGFAASRDGGVGTGASGGPSWCCCIL
ncbi:hypothetical protein ABZ545_06310 [Streptomyces abikoensis]|uniref:Uncharacterized protein n=1 Tax=Streptomyces abikoensis TaxID=97398 RepID=A0ABW7SX79_9ACTN